MNKNNKNIYELKMKRMLYKYNKIYALNNIDGEKLDANSDFLIGSISKLYTIIVLLINPTCTAYCSKVWYLFIMVSLLL